MIQTWHALVNRHEIVTYTKSLVTLTVDLIFVGIVQRYHFIIIIIIFELEIIPIHINPNVQLTCPSPPFFRGPFNFFLSSSASGPLGLFSGVWFLCLKDVWSPNTEECLATAVVILPWMLGSPKSMEFTLHGVCLLCEKATVPSTQQTATVI